MVFVNLLIKPFWVFGIDRTVQNNLGESEYGLYFAIFNFTYLFQILLDFGLQNYNSKEVASDSKKINELLPSILAFKTFLFIIYLIVCIAVAYPLGYLSKPFIWIILINQILLSFNIYLRTNVSAHQHFITDALLSVLDKLLMILFCAALIWGNFSSYPLTIFNFVLAQSVAYAITFIVCLFFSFRLANKLIFKFSFADFYMVAKQTLPYAIIHFLMTTYYRVDGVMLEKLQGLNGSYETGIYAQGYRIMESLNNIGYLFATILLPLFAYKIAQKSEVKTLLKSSISIIFCIAASIIICMYNYKVEMMQLLYSTSNVQYSADVFGYLLLNFFPVAILYVIGTLLTANQNFKLMIYTLAIAVVLNIVLNFYLIKSFGAKGASEATLITQIFMLICYTIYSVRIFKLRVNIKYVFQLVSFVLLSSILIFSIKLITFSNNNLVNLLVHFIFYFMCVPIFSFITGLININMLRLKVGVSQ